MPVWKCLSGNIINQGGQRPWLVSEFEWLEFWKSVSRYWNLNVILYLLKYPSSFILIFEQCLWLNLLRINFNILQFQCLHSTLYSNNMVTWCKNTGFGADRNWMELITICLWEVKALGSSCLPFQCEAPAWWSWTVGGCECYGGRGRGRGGGRLQVSAL